MLSVQRARFARYLTALPVSLAMKTGHASETGMHDGFKVAGGPVWWGFCLRNNEGLSGRCDVDSWAWARSTFGSDRSDVIGIKLQDRSIEIQIRRYGERLWSFQWYTVARMRRLVILLLWFACCVLQTLFVLYVSGKKRNILSVISRVSQSTNQSSQD